MSRKRTETWLALGAAGVGLLILAIAGLWVFMSATAVTLHPDVEAIPSEASGASPARWTAAVEEGRRIAAAHLAERNLPGLSVAVGVAGEIVWAEGLGWADLDNRVPVIPDTRFAIGTASTPLTAAAAGLLIEQGRLRLDDTIQDHVPQLPRKDWPVTLRQVMGHTAGLRSDSGDEGPLLSAHCERPLEALPAFADAALLFEPGTEYRYSNYGWILMSAAIEAVTGEPWFRFMRAHVLEPLGMHDTDMDVAAAATADRATSYFPRFAADPRYGPDPMRPIDLSCYAGAAALVSTPSDLVRFGMAVAEGRLLQPATVGQLHTSQRLPSGEKTGYGLGWDLEAVTLAGEQTGAIGYDGQVLGGPVASLWIFPAHDLAVAVTSNISYAETFALAEKVAGAFVE